MKEKKAALPEQGELFHAGEIIEWFAKDDLMTMEYPIYSLSKNKDLEQRDFKKGNYSVKIIPSSQGSATLFDKDLLIYLASKIIQGKNNKLPVCKTIVVDTRDFLLRTERGIGRGSYERIIDMLNRLRGTTIQTNIETGGIQQTDGFGLIESYRIISEKTRITKGKNSKGNETENEIRRVFQFQVTVSDWFWNAFMAFEVLAIDKQYFLLKSPFDRRLYEIARKHCGKQALWKINIVSLAEKIGSRSNLRLVREDIRRAIRQDQLADYRIALDTSTKPHQVVFFSRDHGIVAKELMAKGLTHWFYSLELPPAMKK